MAIFLIDTGVGRKGCRELWRGELLWVSEKCGGLVEWKWWGFEKQSEKVNSDAQTT